MTFKLRGYTIEGLLGSGSSGDVWRARAGASGAPVALKRIPVDDDASRQQALREGALLAALDHPGLVRLHAVVPTADAVVLVLDLADGGSLADLLAARGRLTPGEVITAVAPVAAALSYLHGEAVVHGDVSPGNVLFTAAGAPLLADVGVARLVGADREVAATAAYVDPAVAAGCAPGPPSDVFMLGAVALHALTGAPPWPGSGESALALAARRRLDDVAARLAAADVPLAMVPVLERALAVDPHRRCTAAELALDLRHSGRPLAVELSAGVARRPPRTVTRSGPRHAAAPGRLPASRVIDDRARPPFERPSAAGLIGAEPPTRQVGPRPRPVLPTVRRRRLMPGRVAVAGAALAFLAAAAVTAALTWPASGDPAARRPAQARPEVETVTGRSSATARPPAPAPVSDAATGRGWPATLARLDDERAAAFAGRDPGLLARVYVPGGLLVADRALLAQLVPPGCGLRGAHTRYEAVAAAARRGDRAAITATATLATSQLVCAGRVRATAPGAGPTRLRLELVRTPAGWRIATQTVASA